ncbi:MAG: hypothetical protein ACP5NV_05360 [Candidatus Woesearchaeota archaeon]
MIDEEHGLCREMMICRNTISIYIIYEKEFTEKELMDAILKNGGILRPNVYQSMEQYMKELEYKKILTHSPAEGKYINHLYEFFNKNNTKIRKIGGPS